MSLGPCQSVSHLSCFALQDRVGVGFAIANTFRAPSLTVYGAVAASWWEGVAGEAAPIPAAKKPQRQEEAGLPVFLSMG